MPVYFGVQNFHAIAYSAISGGVDTLSAINYSVGSISKSSLFS